MQSGIWTLTASDVLLLCNLIPLLWDRMQSPIARRFSPLLALSADDIISCRVEQSYHIFKVHSHRFCHSQVMICNTTQSFIPKIFVESGDFQQEVIRYFKNILADCHIVRWWHHHVICNLKQSHISRRLSQLLTELSDSIFRWVQFASVSNRLLQEHSQTIEEWDYFVMCNSKQDLRRFLHSQVTVFFALCNSKQSLISTRSSHHRGMSLFRHM